MKKLIAIVLVAVMLMAVLAACGGETTTTEAPATTTTNAPITTETPGEGGGEIDPPMTGFEDYVPLYAEGIDIMYGPEPDWWCIKGDAYNGYGVMFEDHHSAFNGEWAMIIEITESMEDVYGLFLFPEVEVEDAEGNITMERQPNPAYDFIVTIDGVDITITNWLNMYGDTQCSYTRMALGDWKPVDGPHNYKISLRVVDKNSGKIQFWANWADENMGMGGYQWDRPTKLGYVENEYFKIPAGVEMMLTGDTNYLEGISGPGTGAEGFDKAFDADVNTKLCNSGNTVVFTVKEGVSYNGLAGIALIGANDDSSYTSRVIREFTLYGSNEGTDAEADYWTEVATVTDSEPLTENFMLRYFEIDSEVTYTNYKIVFNHVNGEGNADTYQISEIIFFVEEDQWSVAE